MSEEENMRTLAAFEKATALFNSLERISIQLQYPQSDILHAIISKVPTPIRIKSLTLSCSAMPSKYMELLRNFRCLEELTLLSPNPEHLSKLPDVLRDLKDTLILLALKVCSSHF